MQTGLYDHLITIALQEQLNLVANQDCIRREPVDLEDAHNDSAQLLEHMLIGCLATFRGADGVARQKRLPDRLIAAVTEEMGSDFSGMSKLMDPLERLLAV